MNEEIISAGEREEPTFDKAEITQFQRNFRRSVVLLVLTVAGFTATESLTLLGRYGFDINERFPELMLFMRGAMLLTWLEVSLIWIRMAVSPKLDYQALANKAAETSQGAAIVHTNMNVVWALRIIVLMQLCGFIGK